MDVNVNHLIFTLIGDQEVIQKVIQHSNTATPHASTATRELDDLMASLSDFKVRSVNNRPLLFCCSLHIKKRISNTTNNDDCQLNRYLRIGLRYWTRAMRFDFVAGAV